jgi:hypothetical protein
MIDLDLVTIDVLRREIPLPAELTCVFLSGSLVSGFANVRSDLDIYVVGGETTPIADASLVVVPLSPPTIMTLNLFHDDLRWDVEYWQNAQVDQVSERLAGLWDVEPGPDLLSDREIDFLYRLSVAQAVTGDEWLARKKEEVDTCRFGQFVALRHFNYADGHMEDALGQLESGDTKSAVVTACLAFRHTTEGLLAYYGELAPSEKWRARKMMRAQPAELPWDRYWALETMSGLDPEAPGEWVGDVIRQCRTIIGRLELA